MPIQITPMTEADIPGAIDTIQQAFADDPYNNWIYPDRSKARPIPLSIPISALTHQQLSPERNRVSLTLRCKWGIRHGLFHVARDTSAPDPSLILGCSMWLLPHPPSQPQSWSLYLASWYLWLGQVRMNLIYGRGGLSTTRYWIWKRRQAEAQNEIWRSEKGYYFCNIVTVLPEWQWRGVGRALMEEVLRRADEEGVGCYLESSRREPNVGIYEKLGFRLVKEMVCSEGEWDEGVTLFCMVREPGGVVVEGEARVGSAEVERRGGM